MADLLALSSLSSSSMIEQTAGTENEIRVEMLTGQQFVHVATVATHFLGNVSSTSSQYVFRHQNVFLVNDTAKLDCF
jgi:hypothetical protein